GRHAGQRHNTSRFDDRQAVACALQPRRSMAGCVAAGEKTRAYARRIALWSSWTFAVAWAAAAFAAGTAGPTLPAHLGLDEAVRIFRVQGGDLVVAEAAVTSAEGDVKIAGGIPNPSVGPSFAHALTYNPNDASCAEANATCSANIYGIEVNDQAALSTILSGKRGLRTKAALAALAAARQGREDAERTLLFQVKQQYIQAVLGRDQLDFALEVRESFGQTLELNRTRYEKGAISEVEVAKVEVEKLEAEQAVAQARQALAVAKASLAFLIA